METARRYLWPKETWSWCRRVGQRWGLAAVELDGNWAPGSWTRDACIFNVFSVMTSIFWGRIHLNFRFKEVYSFTHPWKKVIIMACPFGFFFGNFLPIADTPHCSGFTTCAQAEIESCESNMTWKPPEVEANTCYNCTGQQCTSPSFQKKDTRFIGAATTFGKIARSWSWQFGQSKHFTFA